MAKKTLVQKIYERLTNWMYRARLRNDNFTIIANTCIAGVMYHKLGKQFLSPTINLWMHDVEFYRFLRNMDAYLAKPLLFVPNELGYPTALLGDMTIHFNHYKSQAEAEQKWNERVKRMNKDNLFIICADRPVNGVEVTYEDIASLKNIKCKGKVVFSTRHYADIDYIVPLPKAPDGDFVNTYMFDKSKTMQRWRWENTWDWVHWLNTGEVIVKS